MKFTSLTAITVITVVSSTAVVVWYTLSSLEQTQPNPPPVAATTIATTTLPLFDQYAVRTSNSDFIQDVVALLGQYDFNEQLLGIHNRRSERTLEISQYLLLLFNDPLAMLVSTTSTSTVATLLVETDRPQTAAFLRRMIGQLDAIMVIHKSEINLARPSQLDITIEPIFDDPTSASFPSTIVARAHVVTGLLALFDPANADRFTSAAESISQYAVIAGNDFPVVAYFSKEYAANYVRLVQESESLRAEIESIKLAEW